MEDIDAVDARQHQRRGQPLQQGEGLMEEHHAADHRDHGGQAGEGRGAGGADDGDGAVGQQKGQCGAADAQIQAGGQKAAAGKGQGQILRHRSVDAVIHQGADGEEHRPRQAHEIGLLHGGIGRQLAVVDEINDVAEHRPEQQHIAQRVESRAGPLQQSDDDDAHGGQQDAAHLKFTGHLVEEQRRGQHREDGDAGDDGTALGGGGQLDAIRLEDEVGRRKVQGHPQQRPRLLGLIVDMDDAQQGAQGHGRSAHEKAPAQKGKCRHRTHDALGEHKTQAEQHGAAAGAQHGADLTPTHFTHRDHPLPYRFFAEKGFYLWYTRF